MDSFTLTFRYHPGADGDAQGEVPRALRYQRGPMRNQIQLYYSSLDTVADLELTPPGYVTENQGTRRETFSLLPDNSFLSVNLLVPINHPSRCVEDKGQAQSQRQLFHIKAVTLKEEGEKEREQNRTKEEETCLKGQEEEELSLDSHVVIRYHRGPVLIGQPIRVSVNLRANFNAEFVVIR